MMPDFPCTTADTEPLSMAPAAPPAPGPSLLPQHVLAILRRKWACPVLLALAAGHKRFGALARAVPGLRRSVLAAELYRLTQDGLVQRREVSPKPPEVHYALTGKGSALCRLIRHLRKWEVRHL